MDKLNSIYQIPDAYCSATWKMHAILSQSSLFYIVYNTSISLSVDDWMLIKLNNSIPQVSIFQNIMTLYVSFYKVIVS